MNSTSPPPEAQRFGRSQTPESPRPVHIPEPANIPVLLNQMDPVFNDTATYNILDNQSLSPYAEQPANHGVAGASVDDQDAVQSFFREAENQASAEPIVTNVRSEIPNNSGTTSIADAFPTVTVLGDSAPAQTATSTSLLSLPTSSSHLNEAHRVDGLGNSVQAYLSTNSDPAAAADPQTVPDPEHGGHLQGTQAGEIATNDGVDYQSLLDTITQSASTAPAGEGLIIPASSLPKSPVLAVSLPSIPGLPPKPPPRQDPVEFPSYFYTESALAEASEKPHVTNNETSARNNPNESNLGNDTRSTVNQHRINDAAQTLNDHAANINGLVATTSMQHSHPSLAPGQTRPSQSTTPIDLRRSLDPSERPWSPKTQSVYDQFLEDERRYVTDGIWDKFPSGSRLFVGNLPSEKVTKRDLFHRFFKHGKLAQISIKQAYGFVQFLEASSCLAALNAEQGVEIRGRKVHLEISKPQKNTRNANNKSNQNTTRRRSRSPERNNRRTYSDYRDEPGRRNNDYRNRRSPSPSRGYRPRDDFRPGSRDERSRSPNYGSAYSQVQPPSFDDESALPIPRRDHRSVPDVQLLVLEPEVAQSFINWVEQGFRLKGLQASTIWLNHRLPLPAVIKRQIIEGVQAVVKLTRAAQNNSKIPLQVFDRTAGASNVNFHEYVDLDLAIAADVVVQARARERGASQPFRPPSYAPQPSYQPTNAYVPHPAQAQYPPPVPPQYQHQPPPPPPPLPPQQYPYAPPQGNYRPPPQALVAPTGQPPNIQQLLANLRGSSNQQTASGGQVQTDGNAMHGAYTVTPQYNQTASAPPPYAQYGASPAQLYSPGSSPQGQSQPNVQNIMDQLARYQR